MTAKIFTVLLCLIVLTTAAPSEDLVRAVIANYTQHKWYSGTLAVIQVISTSHTEHSITCSSTPSTILTMTLWYSGSTEDLDALA